MKILFLTRLFYPHIGGVERHVGEISKRLVKMGHKVTVVTERIEGTKEVEEFKGIKVIRIPYPKIRFLGLLYIWFWFLKNRTLINQSDLIHCHDVFIWYLPMRFLHLKKPVYTTFHGWEGVFPPRKKAILIRKLAEKLSWGNICVGDYIAKWYGTKPDYVTYGGVNLDQRVDRPNQEGAVFIGRLDKDTGLPIYLKALDRLNTEYQILFLGDGPLRKEAEKYGKVVGFVKDVKSYVLQSRFVFTSGYLSILEAMATKRLVFCVYDNPLKKDYLEMAPFAKWIVIESDPKKLAKKIKYYLGHPDEEEKLIERAYNWAIKQSWDKVVELYLKLWRAK